MNETGHTTVHKPSKVVLTCGRQQVGAITHAERGSNITRVYCEIAAGYYIPPMLIFQRKRIHPSLEHGASINTLFACTDFGLIDSDSFFLRMKIDRIIVRWFPSCDVLHGIRWVHMRGSEEGNSCWEACFTNGFAFPVKNPFIQLTRDCLFFEVMEEFTCIHSER